MYKGFKQGKISAHQPSFPFALGPEAEAAHLAWCGRTSVLRVTLLFSPHIGMQHQERCPAPLS